ncbi:hypothetical protein Tco_0664511 [Tanacetum coccineum]
MIRSWPDDKKRKSVERDERSIGGGDVRTLLQELESRYEVAVEEHPDGLGRFCRGRGETIGENQVGSGLWRWRFKKPPSGFLNNTLYEKKQMVENEVNRNTPREEEGPERVDLTEQIRTSW